MFIILLLIVLVADGNAVATKVVAAPGKLVFATMDECKAKIADEVEAAQMIIDTDIRLEKGTLIVDGGRCFSREDIMKMRGEKEANS